tara:strand:- start:9422 stop:10066 length:645 start_codon:yes stop_codon:yes gene_type:complete
MLIFLCHSSAHSAVDSAHANKLERLINFNDIEMNAFEEVRFKGETNYQLVLFDTNKVLRAESRNSASGLLMKKTIDLSETPYLNWTWRLEKGLQALPEATKPGDDYAARIYLIHSGGWFFWQTKALNYVWSSRKAKEQTWPNAYAPDNALMKAVRDQSDATGVWFTEKRDVRTDFNAWLGEDISEIEGVAIMTDTDDSEGHAIVYYGDIFFSAD